METLIATGHRARAFLMRLIGGKGMPQAMLSGVATVAALTLVAKAVSFFKDATVAHRFGTADELDAFLLAFSLLSFLAAVIGGGLPEAFLPEYAALRHRRGQHRAQRLAVQAVIWNVAALGLISAGLFFYAPEIIALTGKGFPAVKQAFAIEVLRSLLPFFIFFGLTFHLSTWLRADKNFALAAAAPLLVPASIIGFLLAAGAAVSVRDLIAGTNLGVFAQLLLLFLVLRKTMSARAGYLLTHWEPANRRVLGNALPFLLGGLIMNSAVIVDQAMASWLDAGSVAVLNYSDKMCGIVLALTATAASEAVFPFFADMVARHEWLAVRRHLLRITGLILLVAMPLVVMLVLFAPQIVGLLFERGSFTAVDTARVAGVLRFAALQIPFYIIGVLASRVAVSMQATWFTLAASVGALICNVVFNLLLMGPLGVAGIALSTVFVYLLSALALYAFIFKRLARLSGEGGS